MTFDGLPIVSGGASSTGSQTSTATSVGAYTLERDRETVVINDRCHTKDGESVRNKRTDGARASAETWLLEHARPFDRKDALERPAASLVVGPLMVVDGVHECFEHLPRLRESAFEQGSAEAWWMSANR